MKVATVREMVAWCLEDGINDAERVHRLTELHAYVGKP